MPSLQIDQIADMVKASLYDMGQPKFGQIAQSLTEYPVFTSWFKKGKVTFDSGIGIQRSLMNKLGTSARHVGPAEPDIVNITDLMEQLQVPWRHVTANWGYILQETLMNSGKSVIFNILTPRRISALIELVEELENKAWASPADSSDTNNPYGVPYWVVKNATTGFNGGLPSGFSTLAGINLTNVPTFKNYTFTYSAWSKTDGIKKARKALRKSKFKSPVEYPDIANGIMGRYQIFTNEAVISTTEDVGEGQNENLGRDIASMEGDNMTFRGNPFRFAEKLDADTQNPIYFIDQSTFYPVVLKGDYLRETVRPAPNQHNVVETHTDLTYNFICTDRRRNTVAYAV